MSRTRFLICVALAWVILCLPSRAVAPQRSAEVPPPPIVAAVARYTAYSVGTGTHVAKIVVTFGRTKWYYGTGGRKLYRSQPAEFPLGGECHGWAVARVNAFDRYGYDLYGPIRVLMHFRKDRWMGRMIGHGFADTELKHAGVDPKFIPCLRDHGL